MADELKRYPRPNDTLEIDGRFWTVTGNFMGGQTQESVYGLRVDGVRHDAEAYGKDIRELFVPAIMLHALLKLGVARIHPPEGSQEPVRYHWKRDGILRLEADGGGRFLTLFETVRFVFGGRP